MFHAYDLRPWEKHPGKIESDNLDIVLKTVSEWLIKGIALKHIGLYSSENHNNYRPLSINVKLEIK